MISGTSGEPVEPLIPPKNFSKMNSPVVTSNPPGRGLNIFSKIVTGSTLFLIFVGALVNSTGSGLTVPDWPLSYGTLFPPMVGGVFYEHSHRMAASTVGLMTLILAIGLARREKRKWVRNLGFWALASVILQGTLGGITVLFFLPVAISMLHGILAQTFFVLTILIAYSQSQEYFFRRQIKEDLPQSRLIKLSFVLFILIYCQLILAAFMRHTHSGLAIPDFPRMGGYFWPPFNNAMLQTINVWRFKADLEPVLMWQVVIHCIHRLIAGIIALSAFYLTFKIFKFYRSNKKLVDSILILDNFIVFQILLGILTVLSRKVPWITSLHVVNGAAVLGLSVLFVLRICPLNFQLVKQALLK